MTPTHDPALVALSLAMALQGAYVGLNLAREIAGAVGLRRQRLVAQSALALALGIWTLHFVGMLALPLALSVDFLVLPTLMSFLVCVLVVGVAVVFVGMGPPSAVRLGLAALFMGGGIVTMHYLGMLALHTGAHVTHRPWSVVASVAIGVCASWVALWFGFGAGARRSVWAAAGCLALAIAAMHYTAMAGTAIAPYPAHGGLDAPILSPALLAVVVALVGFLISGLFLLTLVPRAPAPPPGPPPRHRLPVEADGLRRSFDIADLVAVRADGHYTHLFDGAREWFCPLPIAQVEGLLDPDRFARIHRSHIVRLDRIARLRRAGDAGVAVLSGTTAREVPVARARHADLRRRLAGSP